MGAVEYVGPFELWEVVVNGHVVPFLTPTPTDEGGVHLCLDRRLGLDLTEEEALKVLPFVGYATAGEVAGSGGNFGLCPSAHAPLASNAAAVSPTISPQPHSQEKPYTRSSTPPGTVSASWRTCWFQLLTSPDTERSAISSGFASQFYRGSGPLRCQLSKRQAVPLHKSEWQFRPARSHYCCSP